MNILAVLFRISMLLFQCQQWDCKAAYIRHVSFTFFPRKNRLYIFFLLALQPPMGVVFYSLLAALASSLMRFLDHIQRRATVGRTPLNEWSVHCRDLYLTTHNTRNRQTSMPRVGFEPTISAGEQPKTYALDCAATGTGEQVIYTGNLRSNIK